MKMFVIAAEEVMAELCKRSKDRWPDQADSVRELSPPAGVGNKRNMAKLHTGAVRK